MSHGGIRKRMNPKEKVRIPEEKLAQFCRKHHIRKLALFGSVLRDDFAATSDVDVLVEFEPGHTPISVNLIIDFYRGMSLC